jgi:hypothetical protein
MALTNSSKVPYLRGFSIVTPKESRGRKRKIIVPQTIFLKLGFIFVIHNKKIPTI